MRGRHHPGAVLFRLRPRRAKRRRRWGRGRGRRWRGGRCRWRGWGHGGRWRNDVRRRFGRFWCLGCLRRFRRRLEGVEVVVRAEATTRLSGRALSFPQRGARVLKRLARGRHHLAQLRRDGLVDGRRPRLLRHSRRGPGIADRLLHGLSPGVERASQFRERPRCILAFGAYRLVVADLGARLRQLVQRRCHRSDLVVTFLTELPRFRLERNDRGRRGARVGLIRCAIQRGHDVLLAEAARNPLDPSGDARARHHHHRHQRDDPAGRGDRTGRLDAEKPAHAGHQGRAGHCQGKTDRFLAQRLDGGQCAGVEHGVATGHDREIVAAVLALGADDPRHPPDRRMIEEQRLDGGLHEVHEVVVAADVRELVRDDGLDLLRREAAEHSARHEKRRLQPADDHRHLHAGRDRAAARGATRFKRVAIASLASSQRDGAAVVPLVSKR